jgi:predicted nuclease of predicted toxin-antitoxin system
MNLVADENTDRGIVERLRQDGHAVAWIAELSPSVSDEDVLRPAANGGAVMVTEDKDFGELVYRRGLSHAGVLLVRLEGLDNAAELSGAFAVVSPGSAGPVAGERNRSAGPFGPGGRSRWKSPVGTRSSSPSRPRVRCSHV